MLRLESKNTHSSLSNHRQSGLHDRTHRNVLSMHRPDRSLETGLEETLSSTLLSTDNELSQIVREIDAISEALKSEPPETQSIRVAAHPAVWRAVKQALLDRELRYLALTDDLTCLYNRRGFFAAATQQLKLARRRSQALLLFFIDFDNLKKINDTHGHKEGDLALVQVADALEQAFRGSDILARIHGDEFAALAVEASVQHQEIILQRLTKALKKLSSAENRYELSVSTGVARFDPKKPMSLGELMAQADQAMYEKKRKRQEPR